MNCQEPVPRVLILDPDRWRRRGISSALADSQRAQVVEEFDRRRPDVILLSHSLMSAGSMAIETLRQRFPGSAVLVYGENDSIELTADVLSVGARGYFHLSGSAGTLADAVSAVGSGRVWGSREAITLLVDYVAERKVKTAPREMAPDDIEILILLNEGLTNKEIATRLGIAEQTVKSRFTRLYKQFGVRTRLQLLSRALHQGLITPTKIAI